MRRTCIDMVHTLARRDPRVVFIGSDLSPDFLPEMRREMPERFFMEGVSEANVVGMAAGLAMEGFIPYVNTIATFLTRRCYEQVALDVCMHNLPVRLIGNGGGLVYAPLGPTHLAIEDIAIMRALPNMAVVAAADADEMTRLMTASLDWPGPLYIRLAKGGDPVVSRPEYGFIIGAGIVLRDPSAQDPGVLLIGTGVTTTRALAAADTLADEGIQCAVLHLHSIKPLDVDAILAQARRARLVVTIEEHTVNGGLGSAVAEVLAESNDTRRPVLRRIGIDDEFAKDYGNQDWLMESYGLQPPQIAEFVRKEFRRAAVA